LAQTQASVVLAATDVSWTLHIDRGRLRLAAGGVRRPSTVVRGAEAVLAAIVKGRRSGAAAFLDGAITVRGNLALALQLDGLFAAADRPDRFPRSAIARPLGIATSYLEAGPRTAPPVVLLHGLGATNTSMLPTLWDLARDHRVLAPDLPGHGASAAPRASYQAAWFGRWLSAFQDSTNAVPAAVIGNSLGGRVALEAALDRPESVDRLVLLCPSPAFRRLRQLAPVVRLPQPVVGRLPLQIAHQITVEFLRSMFSEPNRLTPAWYDAAADEFRRVFAQPRHRVAFLAAARGIYLEQAYGDRGFWTRLPGLEPPAMFVWGDRDRLVPASFARHVERALPEAGSVVLEDCGHVPQFEHPRDTADLIRGFLDE
jgi:pimeloyl-ACP methyl ester carboxylesterase